MIVQEDIACETGVTLQKSAVSAPLILFFFSGFVGVLCEQIFERLLSVVVGGTASAAAVVLSVFFAGLGLGGWLAGWFTRRKVNPLKAYGIAELIVALCCCAVLAGFDSARTLCAPLLVWAAGSAARMLLARILVAAVVVLPPTIAMGLSFPFLSNLAARIPGRAMYVARLYTVNLFGAALAAAFAPYFLFPWIGLSGGLLLCVGINATVAIYALRAAPGTDFALANPVKPEIGGESETERYPLLGIAFLSGFIFFALEVIWTHIVAVVINTSVYAFSSMLFFVTLGLGLGARATARQSDENRGKLNLGVLFLSCAILLIFQMMLWPRVPMSLYSYGKSIHNFYLGEGLRWVHLAFLLLPVTFVFGMIYPALFNDARIRRARAGKLIGQMGAVNAAGCVLGAAMGSFLLIPRLGSQGSLRLMTMALAVCGLSMTAIQQRGRNRRTAIAISAVVIVVAAALPRWNPLQLTSGLNIYFRVDNVIPTSKLISLHEDTYGGVTTVVETPFTDGTHPKILLTNGKFQGNDGQQTSAQIAFTAIPSLYVARRDAALMIGFGTGQSAGVLRELGYSSIDIAELAPAILAAGRNQFAHINHGILDAREAHVFLEDGRNVLLSRPNTYDLIAMEITSVWFAGATNVYSKDFYDLARTRLNRGGVFQQWIQLHHMGTREAESILATVRASFPYVQLWYFRTAGVIVAADHPLTVAPNSRTAARDCLLHYFHGNAQETDSFLKEMESSEFLDENAVNRLWARRPPVNTDWNRVAGVRNAAL